ncbi:lytic transglycosylase domain-containing protein [Thauera sinica]|uniref:Lytic transglycosylase domain-containing protein n=1 Tax=Thauera sinica TaxID=2665146 RepID=A0ABW1ANJ3_9RHOO|nr:lytic transglycosylase domain-containing protein [Thauera sp. K11]ATE60499.1 transglycosylase [Thauera sp. K11]
MRLSLVSLALLLASLHCAANTLYGFVDESGVAHFSDFKVDGRYKRLMGSEPSAQRPSARGTRQAPPPRLRARVESIAGEHGVDPALAMAVVEVESAYRPDARSPKGALGLMQLMPATAQRYGVSDPLDPDDNLRGGIRYLRDLLDQFGSTELALAAYNAGEGAVMRHGYAIPPYAETQAYVPRVLQRYGSLQRKP